MLAIYILIGTPGGRSLGFGFWQANMRVPAWPPAKSARESSRQYVYWDSRSQEYVVSFPKSLQTGAAGGKEMVEFRFQPQFVVDPTITVRLGQGEAPFVTYEYSLTNRATAKGAARWFSLVVPADDDSATVSHSEWCASNGGPGQPVAPQAALFRGPSLRDPANMGRFVSWSASSKGHPIEPGDTLGGFRLRSKLLPGITTAYVHTGLALRLPFAIPVEVHDQIVPLLPPENNYKWLATIGPKFRPDSTPAEVARDFEEAIARLIEDKRVSRDSAFITEVRAMLAKIASTEKRSPVRFLAKPSPGIERGLSEALTLTLEGIGQN